MTSLPHKPAPFNRTSAANRLPDYPGLMATARQIERKYTTTPGLALAVAELISASIAEARR
jgi:hypothetical protein